MFSGNHGGIEVSKINNNDASTFNFQFYSRFGRYFTLTATTTIHKTKYSVLFSLLQVSGHSQNIFHGRVMGLSHIDQRKSEIQVIKIYAGPMCVFLMCSQWPYQGK